VQESSSPAVGPSDFDNVATDPTEVSIATMLPQRYNDSGTVFNRTSGSVQQCPTGYENAGVQDTLKAYGRTSEIVGTYLDSSLQIQVTVWVIHSTAGQRGRGGIYNIDRPGESGGPQTWKDEGPWRRRGNIRRSCGNAR
jgi:hypothetical protein